MQKVGGLSLLFADDHGPTGNSVSWEGFVVVVVHGCKVQDEKAESNKQTCFLLRPLGVLGGDFVYLCFGCARV